QSWRSVASSIRLANSSECDIWSFSSVVLRPGASAVATQASSGDLPISRPVDDAELDRPKRGPGTSRYTELGVDVLDVGVGRLGRDGQGLTDLPDRLALGEEGQHLPLAVREARGLGPLAAPAPLPGGLQVRPGRRPVRGRGRGRLAAAW